jgi:hypothetical protein
VSVHPENPFQEEGEEGGTATEGKGGHIPTSSLPRASEGVYPEARWLNLSVAVYIMGPWTIRVAPQARGLGNVTDKEQQVRKEVWENPHALEGEGDESDAHCAGELLTGEWSSPEC